MKAIEAQHYPWTRVWSRDYNQVLWDSSIDAGTVDDFVISSGEDWLPVIRDHTPKDRWAGRLEVDRSGETVAVNLRQEYEYLQYIVNWPAVE